MQVSGNLIELLKRLEGFRTTAYWDVNHYSIGYGTPAKNSNATITRSEAETQLRLHVKEAEGCINRNVNVSLLNQNQYDVCVSVAYNKGCGGFTKSDLYNYINSGDMQAAAAWFTNKNVCCNAGGKYHSGLAYRRMAEQQLFTQGTTSQFWLFAAMAERYKVHQYVVVGIAALLTGTFILQQKGYIK